MDEQEKTEMLRSACDRIMSESNAIAFALLDYESGFRFALNADRMKMPGANWIGTGAGCGAGRNQPTKR